MKGGETEMAYMTSVNAMPAVSVELDNCLFRLAQGETAALEPLYRETSASVYLSLIHI